MGKTAITGPGVYVTCVKGKENQSAREIIDVFEGVSLYVPRKQGTDECT